MKPRETINIKALIVAPLTVPMAWGLFLLIFQRGWPQHEYVILLGSVTLAVYALVFCFGVPALLAMRALKLISTTNILLAGFAIGAFGYVSMTAINNPYALQISLAIYGGILGLLVAIAYLAGGFITSKSIEGQG